MKYYFKCPQCGHDEEFYNVSNESSTVHGCLILLLGGILPALVFSDYGAHRAQCANCRHVFRRPPLPQSRVSALAKWMLVILLGAAGFALYLEAFPRGSVDVPILSLVTFMENLVLAHPRAAGLALFMTAALFVSFCLLVSAISNHVLRKKLRETYAFHPPKYPRQQGDDAGASTPDAM